MSNLEIGFAGLLVALVLIALRMNIGIVLVIVSFVGISAILNVKAAFGVLTAVPYNFVGDWNLSAIPMFLLMGFLAGTTGLTTGLFGTMRLLLYRLPGGLASAAVCACAIFAAASGSSVATASAMSRIASPEMLRYRYDPGLATGVVAASGTLGSLIPPSILLLIYGYFAQVSVAQLFVAGFLPGLLSVILYVSMITARCTINPALAPKPKERPSREETAAALRGFWPLPTLIFFIFFGIFFGIFTPTEAGAVGTALVLLIAVFHRTLNFAVVYDALKQTVRGTAALFLVAIGTVFLTRFLALSQVPTFVTSLFLEADAGVYMIIFVIAVAYILLGMFVDSIGLLLLTLPIFLPVAEAVDMNLIWLGIILVKLLEIGLITPPVGLNVYVINGALRNLVPLDKIFLGVTWFIAVDIVTLVLLAAFPAIALFLPTLMFD